MAAYYHILSPFEIAIEDNAELEKQFLERYGQDFTLQATNWIERFSPKLPDGTRLDFSYTKKTYQLSTEMVRKEFSAFAQIFFETWQQLYESKFKGKFAATQLTPAQLTTQINDANTLIHQYPLASDQLEQQLKQLNSNYFFSIEGILPQVVYQGYPLKTGRNTSLFALDFLHSYEKMGIAPDEYAAMYMLVDNIKEKYSTQFVLAKYLFIAGY